MLTIFRVEICSDIMKLTDKVGSVFIFGDLVGLSVDRTGLSVGEKEGYIREMVETLCATKDRSELFIARERIMTIIKVEIGTQ